MMMSRPKGKRDPAVLRAAIKSFMAGEKLVDIAARHRVKQPSVSYWLRKYGPKFYPKTFKLRKQGRRMATEPCDRDKEIMRLVVTEGKKCAEVSRTYGITRSRVVGIVKTWVDRGYKVPPPFKVNDLIAWKGYELRVTRVNDSTHGKVENAANGEVIDPFYWFSHGEMARLIK